MAHREPRRKHWLFLVSHRETEQKSRKDALMSRPALVQKFLEPSKHSADLIGLAEVSDGIRN
jgi:hypothetical protein